MLPHLCLLAGLLLACSLAPHGAAAQNGDQPDLVSTPDSAQNGHTGGTAIVVPEGPRANGSNSPGTASNAPSPSYYPTYPPPQPRLSKGLLITGVSVLGGSYAMSLLFGFALTTTDPDDCARCNAIGRPMFVPVVGPFLAANESDGDRALLAGLGIVEVVGLALTLGGIVKYRNSKERARQQGYVVELDRGKVLTLDVATSARLVGPQLSLSF